MKEEGDIQTLDRVHFFPNHCCRLHSWWYSSDTHFAHGEKNLVNFVCHQADMVGSTSISFQGLFAIWVEKLGSQEFPVSPKSEWGPTSDSDVQFKFPMPSSKSFVLIWDSEFQTLILKSYWTCFWLTFWFESYFISLNQVFWVQGISFWLLFSCERSEEM